MKKGVTYKYIGKVYTFMGFRPKARVHVVDKKGNDLYLYAPHFVDHAKLMPVKPIPPRPSLAKLIDNGWDVHITNEVRRVSIYGMRNFVVKVIWKAVKRISSSKEMVRACKWEGFDTAKEALADLLKNIK